MNDTIKPFGIRRNWDYVKEALKIKVKSLIEYKVNVFSGFLMSIIYSLLFVLFFVVIGTKFNDLLGWTFNEYFFYIIIIGFNATFFGTFWFSQNLRYVLLTGHINLFLTKPINYFLQHFLDSSTLIFGSSSLIYLCALVYYILTVGIQITLYEFLCVFILMFLTGIFFVLVHRFFDALRFFYKAEDNVFMTTYRMFYANFDRFPATIFEGKIGFLTYFCANAYYGAYLTEFVFGQIGYSEVYTMFIYLIGLIFVFGTFIYLLWHFGLKNYEGYD